MFLAIPKIEARDIDGEADLTVEFQYRPVVGWNLGDASFYAIHYQRCVLGGRSPSPDDTVLSDEIWMALYHIAEYALSNYRGGDGFMAVKMLSRLTKYLVTVAKRSLSMLQQEMGSAP